jgi:DNA replication protein DnaC
MTTTNPVVDAARVELLLHELRLPSIRLMWVKLAEQSDKEGWPAARFLAVLAEHEMADRGRRRFERHLIEARLPAGKTLATFDFEAVPMVSKAQVMALAAGDAWLEKGANILLFGPPGGGKSHLSAALGLALVENGWRVLFARTTDLVQQLQIARRELALESAIAKLDRYDLLILDDIAYVTKDQAETSVLFELIAARYERRSMLITANQPFAEWSKIFPDHAMTLAAIDRLVHHSTILEMNVESYRRREALDRKRGRGRPPRTSSAGPSHQMILNFFALRLAGGSGGGLPVFNAWLIAISANVIGHRPLATAKSISVAIRHSCCRCCTSGSDSI